MKNKSESDSFDIVLHLGLPKTGTTFLQKEVFPKLDINFYDMSSMDGLDLGIKLDKDKVNLISSEQFYGKPMELDYPRHSSDEMLRIARRLYRLFPYARILVGTRNKKSWLYSVYKQYTRRVGTLINFKDFKDQFDEGFLDFERYIDFLKEKFPEVYVYRYEELKENHQKFVDDICEYLGVDAPVVDNVVYNKSFTKGQLELIDAIHSIEIKVYRVLRYIIELYNRRFS